MPRLVSYLGQTAFGLFSLTWAMVGYLSFLDVGVNRAATKFVSEHLAEQDHESARGIVRTAILANLAMGLAGGITVALASPFLVHSIFRISADSTSASHSSVLCRGLAVPVLLAQGIFRAVLSSYQRFGVIDAVEASATTAQWGVAGILAWQGHGLPWWCSRRCWRECAQLPFMELWWSACFRILTFSAETIFRDCASWLGSAVG